MQNILTVSLVAFGILFIIRTLINGSRKTDLETFREVLKDEQEANFSRSKEIPQELFIIPPSHLIESLSPSYLDIPAEKDTLFNRTYHLLLDKSKQQMLTQNAGLTNLELKKTFGAGNLDKIADYESNFYEYIHTANNYAQLLFENSLVKEAEKLLRSTIFDVHSDVIKTYTLLFDYYKEYDKLQLNTFIKEINQPQLDLNENFKTTLDKLIHENYAS